MIDSNVKREIESQVRQSEKRIKLYIDKKINELKKLIKK